MDTATIMAERRYPTMNESSRGVAMALLRMVFLFLILAPAPQIE